MNIKNIIIIFTVLLIIITITAYLLNISTRNKIIEEIPAPTPKRISTQAPAFTYDEKSNSRLNSLLKNRQNLSIQDQAVKNKLIAMNNPLYENDDISIGYYAKSDTFQVEIRTISINSAKEQAASWFNKMNFSKEGICKLPLVFYMNTQTGESLRDLNIKFNPLTPGC